MCNLAQGILITGLLYSDDDKTTQRGDTPLTQTSVTIYALFLTSAVLIAFHIRQY